jgi:uncharacterized protein involved in type VI secretion and phage assembly
MTTTPKEIFEAMNVTKILVAILESEKEVKVPIDIFLNSESKDRGLNVEYNEEESSFIFRLKEEDEQQNIEEDDNNE